MYGKGFGHVLPTIPALLPTNGRGRGVWWAVAHRSLQDVFQFLCDHLYWPLLHLEAAVDIGHGALGIAVASACHDLCQGCMRLAEHRQVGVAQAMEVEVADAHLADALALVGERARLDVLAIGLRADEVEARAGCRVALLEGDDLLDRAALVVLGGEDVVVEVVLSVGQLVGPLLLTPAPQQRQDDLAVEGQRAMAAFRLEVAEIV